MIAEIAMMAMLTQPDTTNGTLRNLFAVSVVADVATTLMDGRDGYRVPDWYGWEESNPISRMLLDADESNATYIIGMAVYTRITLSVTKNIGRKYPLAEKILLVGLTAAHSYCATDNYRLYLRVQLMGSRH